MRATIWQIGLFQRLEGNNKEAICKLCIENKEKKYTFSVNNFTTTNLVYHLKSKHKNTEFYKLFFKLEKEKENKKIKCEEDFNNKLAQKIEAQTEDNNELSQINSEQLLQITEQLLFNNLVEINKEGQRLSQNNSEKMEQQQNPQPEVQITEQLLFNNLVEINKEGRKLSQNNSEKMEQQQNPQPEDSFALKPGEDLDVELKKAKLQYYRIQMEQQQKPPSLKDSVALKPGEDMDTELKKAKLEYFRIQTILAEEQISNLKIQRKYTENYCYTANTYFVAIDKAEQIIVNISDEERRERRISYYQWIPFFLIFQAGCFKVPALIWKYFHAQSGMKVGEILRIATSEANSDPTIRADNINSLCNHLQKRRIRPHRFFRLLNMKYSAYYVTLVYLLINHTVQCVLVLNVFMEKAFMLLWGWYTVLAIITLANISAWFYGYLSTASAEHFIFNHLEMAGEPLFDKDPNILQPKQIQQCVAKFIVKYLKTDGLFILRLIAQHADVQMSTQLIYKMWTSHYIIEKQRESLKKSEPIWKRHLLALEKMTLQVELGEGEEEMQEHTYPKMGHRRESITSLAESETTRC
uniref:Innexin n=1 Tax=Meloidogyne javanica TaxID=6303 RepID=A0A915N2A5_MELJA